MGKYYLYAIDHNGCPAYQPKSGLDYLFYAESNAWVIGAQVQWLPFITDTCELQVKLSQFCLKMLLGPIHKWHQLFWASF